MSATATALAKEVLDQEQSKKATRRGTYTVSEVADFFGVSIRTIRRRIESGHLKTYTPPPFKARKYVRAEDLQAFMLTATTKTTPTAQE